MYKRRLVSCAQDFQVMCYRRARREGGREGMELSCDHWNHLCQNTPSTHCTHYTLHKHFNITLQYTRYTTTSPLLYSLQPAPEIEIYKGKWVQVSQIHQAEGVCPVHYMYNVYVFYRWDS